MADPRLMNRSGSTDITNLKKSTTSRPFTGTGSRSRPRTAATSTGYADNELICAITESRGISPTVGLSFVNLSTSEAVLCQFADTQTYARTCHKLKVFTPSEIVYASNAEDSKLLSIVRENLDVERSDILMTPIDRRYWSETSGHEYVNQLAFAEDLESLCMSIGGNYFATCCFAAVLKYTDLSLGCTFAAHSLRIKFETSEGSTLIDLSTIACLELIQNSQNSKSKDCLLGILNENLTPMGARFLRSNILQPSTDATKLQERYEAVEELGTREEMFLAVRQSLGTFVDTDKALAALVVLPVKPTFSYMEQSVNNVLMLKAFVDAIKPVWQAMTGVVTTELQKIRQLCSPENYEDVQQLIKDTLNDDVTFSRQAAELRQQRVYAIRAGLNDFLDVARQTFKEANTDAYKLSQDLGDEHNLPLELKYEVARQFYIRLPLSTLEERQLSEVFINVDRNRKYIECQTLELLKLNQKITQAHNEVINMSDSTIQTLIEQVRPKLHPIFKISESLATLDMLSSFAQLLATHEYVKPEFTDALAIKSGRHPIRERIHREKYIPNDVYAAKQSRFQIITGCNMSGKSIYIRSIALMVIMAQIGSFVPADYASFPMTHQLFARVSTDDSVEANVSTFAAEMREMAFILHNIEPRSLVIIDELGRGTSTSDGLAIAIAMAEALIQSEAFVWFVTHFRELPKILEERAGVINLHLAVDIADDFSTIKMKYKICEGYEEEKYYGLAIARAADLPRNVIDTAARVSEILNRRNRQQQSDDKALTLARRRKLVLNLMEQLRQARDGNMDPKALRARLTSLQNEFTMRLSMLKEKPVDSEEGGGEFTTGTETESSVIRA